MSEIFKSNIVWLFHGALMAFVNFIVLVHKLAHGKRNPRFVLRIPKKQDKKGNLLEELSYNFSQSSVKRRGLKLELFIL